MASENADAEESASPGLPRAAKSAASGSERADEQAYLAELLSEISACRVCEAHLPLGPRPVLQASASARLLIISQAPGKRVHLSGIPWNDASGDRLRDWLGLDRATFYDKSRVAIVPMGFCYPGVMKNGGDKPPRPECAPLWHDRIAEGLPDVRLTLLIGRYAQQRYLGARRKDTLAETVKAYAEYQPKYLPLPHPSWRVQVWMRKNVWFEEVLLPRLRATVKSALYDRA